MFITKVIPSVSLTFTLILSARFTKCSLVIIAVVTVVGWRAEARVHKFSHGHLLKMWNSYYKKIINKIDLSRFPVKVELGVDGTDLTVSIDNACRAKGTPMSIVLRRPLIRTESREETVQYIYWNIQELLLHELAECFHVDNRVAYDPHLAEKQGLILGIPNKEWNGRAVLPE